jgi:hypothetical protein
VNKRDNKQSYISRLCSFFPVFHSIGGTGLEAMPWSRYLRHRIICAHTLYRQASMNTPSQSSTTPVDGQEVRGVLPVSEIDPLEALACEQLGIRNPCAMVDLVVSRAVRAARSLSSPTEPLLLTTVADIFVRNEHSSCICSLTIPPDDMRSSFVHLCSLENPLPVDCEHIFLAAQYNRIYGHLPSAIQISAFQGRVTILIVPGGRREVESQPARNTDKLPVHTAECDTGTCSVCGDLMSPGHKILTLPCGHQYHSDRKECLGEGSVLDWLSSHDSCPNCRKPASVEDVKDEDDDQDRDARTPKRRRLT